MSKNFDVIIVGGGTAGISIAAGLRKSEPSFNIGLFEPSDWHYYQPLYTLVGAGAEKVEATRRETSSVIPPGVEWIRKSVSGFDPGQNQVAAGSDTYNYRYLVIACGLQIDWHLIEGLEDTLGKNNVCSVYGYRESSDTWRLLENYKGGKTIFTAAWTPVKCGGAAQKVMYLVDAFLRKKKLRSGSSIQFISSGTKVFAVPGFDKTLESLIRKKDITTRFYHDLKKVDGETKTAWFKVHEPDKPESVIEEKFDFLHVVPPQSAPDIIKNSELSIQEGPQKGWLDVDKHTLQHKRYPNVFGLGDVAGLPTAKTGAAVRKQGPVLIGNLSAVNKDQAPVLSYSGYSACPILTDFHHVLLAEFGYGNKPMPSFPIKMTRPRYSMYLLKHYLLPWYYWNRMLKGKF